MKGLRELICHICQDADTWIMGGACSDCIMEFKSQEERVKNHIVKVGDLVAMGNVCRICETEKFVICNYHAECRLFGHTFDFINGEWFRGKNKYD